jgi:pimeloyl-ACP methyl ester carboxylesterase
VDRAVLDDLTLEYEDSGSGEPVVCIHGAFVADAFRPLRSERVLSSRYRLITYHRRGYVGSSPLAGTPTLADEAEDCRGLLAYLGVECAHVVGHSFGGAVALQLALDAPQLVHTLSLLEAALIVGESLDLYRRALEQSIERYREVGAQVAVDEFLQARWPTYRERLEQVLPGALEQAVTHAPTSFSADVRAAIDSHFGEAEARKVAQPALVVLGEKSVALHPRFGETYRLLLDWLPNAEGVVVPGATHFLQMENPRVVAEALADFYGRNPFAGS